MSSVPCKGTVYRMVRAFWPAGSLVDRNTVQKHYVLTEVGCQNPFTRVQQNFQNMSIWNWGCTKLVPQYWDARSWYCRLL